MQRHDVLDRHLLDLDEASGRFTDDSHVVRDHLCLIADAPHLLALAELG